MVYLECNYNKYGKIKNMMKVTNYEDIKTVVNTNKKK